MDLMRVRTLLPIGGLLITALLLSAMLLSLPAAALAQHQGHHPESGNAQADKPATGPAKCEMCKSMMQRMETMAKLKAVLNEARNAAQAEDATKTVEKIDEALSLMEQQHQAMHAMMAQHMQKMHKGMMGKGMMGKGKMGKGKMENGMTADEMKCPMCEKMMGQAEADKVVNARCPIMGNKIDPGNVPDDLTREWKGKKIGFCCAACPPKWDKLSDEEKQEKLDAAMAKPATDEKPGNHGAHHDG
jgi:hypothetical protein